MTWLRSGGKIAGIVFACSTSFVVGVGVGVLPTPPSSTTAPTAPVPVQVPSEVPVPVTNTVVIKERVEVPVEITHERVVVQYDLPEACDTMVDALAGTGKLNEAISADVSQILPLIDQANRYIVDRDYESLNTLIDKLRPLKNQTGTDQIKFAEALRHFTITLTECRQEIEK